MKQKLMKGLLSLVLFFALFNIMNVKTFAATTPVSFEMKFNQTEARKVFKMVNDFRQSDDAWYWNITNTEKVEVKNLRPLKYDYDLEKVAMLRAQELIARFDHLRPNGQLCFFAGDDLNYKGFYCGENIACGFGNAQAVHLGWREDNANHQGQGHRINMLDKYFGAIGLACAEYRGTTFWVEIFADEAVNTIATPANNSFTIAKINVDKLLCQHRFSTTLKAVPATCTKEGKTEGSHCSTCKKIFKTQTVIKKTAHKYVSKVVKPTYFADGYTLHTCSICKKSYKDKITKKLVLKVPVVSSLKSGSKSFTVKLKAKVTGATGYQVQYSTSSKFSNAKTVKITTTKTTIKKLSSKKKYYIRIRAYRTEKGKTVYSTWTKAKTITTKK